MSKILCVFTGGTIASKKTKDGNFSLDKVAAFGLIKLYKEKYKEEFLNNEFETVEALNIMSENMQVSHINQIIKVLKEIDFDKYDGIIITHGTDTLAYTANILSILLAGVKIPVVLIASNQTIEEDYFGGLYNFRSAVCFIEEEIAGCFVIFDRHSKTDYREVVYLAERIKTSINYKNIFVSVADKDFAFLKDGKFRIIDNDLNKECFDEKTGKMLLSKVDNLDANILLISPHTNLNYNNFNLDNVDAVLHDLYHSASANTLEHSKYSVLSLHERLKKKNIPLFFANFEKKYKEDDSYRYPGTNILWEIAENTISSTSIEFAYAKLLIAFSIFDNKDDINKFLDEEIHFERIE